MLKRPGKDRLIAVIRPRSECRGNVARNERPTSVIWISCILAFRHVALLRRTGGPTLEGAGTLFDSRQPRSAARPGSRHALAPRPLCVGLCVHGDEQQFLTAQAVQASALGSSYARTTSE